MSFSSASAELNTDKLSENEIILVKQLLTRLEPLIKEKEKDGSIMKLSFRELYRPCSKKEKTFLNDFRHINAKKVGVKIPYRGIATGSENLVKITGQKMNTKDGEKEVPPQYLPQDVYDKYMAMMAAMKKDIGRSLYVESGYRSSAYQLYLFIYFLKNHEYSIKETVKWVALPGYSEHGDPVHTAIDFINEYGINGEYNIPEFEALPEYDWLMKNAGRFGFVLSYPKNAGANITYEPWHWRYDGLK